MTLKYLIGGNPAGATSFTASYLNAAGYKASHEGIYHHDGRLTYSNDYDCLAEVNYTVCDWMHMEPVNALPVMLIMRNPMDILNSLVSRGFRLGKPVNPDAIMRDIVDRYTKYLDSGRIMAVIRIEHDISLLCDILGIDVLPNTDNLFSKHHNHDVVKLRDIELSKYPFYKEFKFFTDKHYERQD